jgi:hypothetical protein
MDKYCYIENTKDFIWTKNESWSYKMAMWISSSLKKCFSSRAKY